MNILVYAGHPAQYHFFKNAIRKLESDGHKVKLLIKTKDILEDLVQEDGIEYENIQPKLRKNSKLSILLAAVKRTKRVMSIARKFKADILVGGDSSIAWSGWLLGRPSITVLEDDIEVVHSYARITYPFSKTILVPRVCRVGKWEKKKIPYDGYMKLAYLHPSYFAPDEEIVRSYGIAEPFMLVRLAKLTAYHDTGINGLDVSLVQKVIEISESRGYRVYITSEGDVDDSLKQYQLKIRHKDIHHIIAFSSMLVSDSQSMSVEAAVLGIPSIRFSDFSGRISVLEELENKYRLTFGIKTSEPQALLDKFSELLRLDGLKEDFQQRRLAMLKDKIDVTAFLVSFIENYSDRIK
jgi:predicted glycosyltransferase